jgi:phage terminase large subunit-like protein
VTAEVLDFTLDLSVSEPQAEVLAANLEGGARDTLAVAGIRGGKTQVGALATVVRALREPTEEDQCHAVVSPTFPMSKIGPEPKLLKLLNDRSRFPVSPLLHYARSERALYLRNLLGSVSKLRIFSGENPDRWRGDAWLSAWLDEAARLTKDAYDVAQGRLADTDGPCLITTTPDGYNFVYDLARQATEAAAREGYALRRSPDGSVVLVSWRSTVNPFLRSLRGFERLAVRYDPDTYEQEVNAGFIARTGRVYKAFERERHLKARPLLPGPIYVGQDFNVDRMVSTFHQRVPAAGGVEGIHVLAELEIRDADTHLLVRRLREWCAKRGFSADRLVVCPDATGRKRQTAAAQRSAPSDLAILRDAGFAVRAFRSNPHVKDRVNAVNGLYYNGRATVDPGCVLLVEALERQKWTESGEPEKDGILDNRTDSHGYAVWYNFPLRRPRAATGPEPGRRAA